MDIFAEFIEYLIRFPTFDVRAIGRDSLQIVYLLHPDDCPTPKSKRWKLP